MSIDSGAVGIIVCFIAVFCHSSIFVFAYPSGAGQCNGSGPSVSGIHLGPPATTGSLSDGNFEVRVDGVVLSSSDDGSSSMLIESGIQHEIEVVGATYRGILIRFEGITDSGGDVPQITDVTPGPGLADAVVCVGNIVGVTHTDGNDKTAAASATFTVAEGGEGEGGGVVIDITVVVALYPASIYYYSPFAVTMELEQESTDPPTRAPITSSPTRVPTDSPVARTATPTQSPTNSSINPTSLPINSPTSVPKTTSSSSPTPRPTIIPAPKTTAGPTASKSTTKAPTTSAPISSTPTVTNSTANPTSTMPTKSPTLKSNRDDDNDVDLRQVIVDELLKEYVCSRYDVPLCHDG